jgi:hypothetical protein
MVFINEGGSLCADAPMIALSAVVDEPDAAVKKGDGKFVATASGEEMRLKLFRHRERVVINQEHVSLN